MINQLIAADRACVIAPAGHGKTHLIVQAIEMHEGNRQLILTHTHAGVKSIRDKLRSAGVSYKNYHIATIDGLALKYASSYPQTSQLTSTPDAETWWNDVRVAGQAIFATSNGRRILSNNFSGVYVDEYQDCSPEQHSFILQLAETLPCRVLGDPLQGIFDFGHNLIVNWNNDVFPNFGQPLRLTIPWRWNNCGEVELGEWLTGIRSALLRGHQFDVQQNSPSSVWYLQKTDDNIRHACFAKNKAAGSVVAIDDIPQKTHSIASKFRGLYSSMEEIECKDLKKWCKVFESSSGHERVIAIIDFSAKCMTQVSTPLKGLKQKCSRGERNLLKQIRKNNLREIATSLNPIVENESFSLVENALRIILSHTNGYLYRRELWQEMLNTLRQYQIGDFESLEETAIAIRERGQIFGRRVDNQVISRTLLVKGLEFDHGIVLDADQLGAKNLYVAMTRGSKSLTILSSSPIIQKPSPWATA